MKKLLIILLIAGVFSGEFARAQGHGFGGGFYRPATTVFVGGGIGFGLGLYAPFYPYYGYPYYAYPSAQYRPSKLDQEIADINHDYDQKIQSVKMDTGLTGKDRRQQIRDLKEARDRQIDQARKDYYKQG
jgi:hypothetical protein